MNDDRSDADYPGRSAVRGWRKKLLEPDPPKWEGLGRLIDALPDLPESPLGWLRLAGAAASLVILVHAVWVAWFSGTALAPIDLSRRADGSFAIQQAVLELNPEMSPVLVEIGVETRGDGSLEFDYELTAPDGRTVVKFHGPPPARLPGEQRQSVWQGSTDVARFAVDRAGRYTLRATVIAGAWQELRAAQIRVRRNATESHFFRNMLGLVLIYVAIGRWLKWRTGAPPPAAEIEAAAPPSGPALTTSERWKERLVLEVSALVVSLVRVPLTGYYAAVILIGIAMGLEGGGGSRANAVEAFIKSDLGGRILSWVLPQGEFHGWAGLWALGWAAGIATLAIYLVTLPVRLLWPRRPPLTFGARARRLFWLHVALVVGAAIWSWQNSMVGNASYEEAIIFYTFFVAVAYPPALLLSATTGGIEARLERLESSRRRADVGSG
jgi:hypothetical protein